MSHECGVPTCTSTETRLYISGRRCAQHTPAAMAGRPEPPDGDASWMARVRYHTLAGAKGATDINKTRPGGYLSRQSAAKKAAAWEASQRW